MVSLFQGAGLEGVYCILIAETKHYFWEYVMFHGFEYLILVLIHSHLRLVYIH